MSKKGERLHYIDIAKGLLILMVVLGHMPQVADKHNINNSLFEAIRFSSRLWVSFFMPAFFIITGYCSNYSIPPYGYLKKNIKTLLVPSFTLMAICVWIDNILKGSINVVDYLSVGFTTFLQKGGLYWFLTALFISKILYYIIRNNIKSFYLQLFILFLLMNFGCIGNHILSFEPWYLWHALIMTVFLFIGDKYGDILKEYFSNSFALTKKIILTVLVLYMLIWGGQFLLSYRLPCVTQLIVLEIYETPFLLMLACFGTIIIIYLSLKIDKNRCLEFLGRHSLVIYCLHIFFAHKILVMFGSCLNTNNYVAYMLTFFFIIIVVALCCSISLILNSKHLKFLVGKF